MFTTYDPFRRPATSSRLPFDVVRFEDHFEVHIDLPGADVSSVDLTVDGRDLTLSAARTAELPEGATLVSQGRDIGPITRTFHLGERLDTGGVSADYNNGVLVVTVPVAETAKARKIAIGHGESPTLEASVLEGQAKAA